MPKCKKVFKESKEVPSPPFTRNSLIIKRSANGIDKANQNIQARLAPAAFYGR